jgi:hypothetical protein
VWFLALIIVMIMPPGPILFLLIGVSSVKVSMVTAGFNFPALVVNTFVAIPHMVVLVGRVIDAIRARAAQPLITKVEESGPANRNEERCLCPRNIRKCLLVGVGLT